MILKKSTCPNSIQVTKLFQNCVVWSTLSFCTLANFRKKNHLMQFGWCDSSLLSGVISIPGCSATLLFYFFKQKLLLWSSLACAKTQDRCSNGAVENPQEETYYWGKKLPLHWRLKKEFTLPLLILLLQVKCNGLCKRPGDSTFS